MKFVRQVVVLWVLAITACSHGVGVTPAGVPGAPVAPFARPDTLHVVPFFYFRRPTGYTPLGSPGGRRGLFGTSALMFGSAPAGGNAHCAAGKGKGCGVIYELTPKVGSSIAYTENVLVTFTGTNGAVPYASLNSDPSNDLYGTTYYGGRYEAGTVFVLHPSGSGYTYSIIHNFGKGADGAHPFAGVVDSNGVLYGTTIGGGTYKRDLCKARGGSPDGTCGTVYRIDLATGHERVIHNFGAGGDGASPYGGVFGALRFGTLYGTTVLGGSNAYCGTVYSLTLSSGEEHILHNFGGSPDGCKSYGGLAERGGYVYGTTSEGGENLGLSSGGTVFRVNTTTGVEQVLHTFGKDADSDDGLQPEAALRIVRGKLYGTTAHGGGSSACTEGCGTVFHISPEGADYKVLAIFADGRAGNNPTDALLYSNGSFYGTTSAGGMHGLGAGFKLTPKF
ncbi:MAG: choice-of-anchor tandem repeat GloVer-containing protein [Candidatus Tumulicola sp.]